MRREAGRLAPSYAPLLLRVARLIAPALLLPCAACRAGGKGATGYRGTAAAWGKPLQRDSYHNQRPAVMDQKSNHWICRGSVLTSIAAPLQRMMGDS
ncbi:hypothetical protein HAX54_002666 [Datura stramonium]|uniref:Uncharacterized protein n=1 Tax=Datura stramonium TaxID=4076 RepID=A0ABS8WUG9_DATST|nr:hypothetical protein [Datura stramonium]